tara:strand:- start:308 stop:463 length:156 start_codon:yes stop_codon:yes gene_type:complete
MTNKNKQNQTGFIHLYNPKKEGLGDYDINYINANKKLNKQITNKSFRRYAA